MQFDFNGNAIRYSLTGTRYDLSVFRLKENQAQIWRGSGCHGKTNATGISVDAGGGGAGVVWVWQSDAG